MVVGMYHAGKTSLVHNLIDDFDKGKGKESTVGLTVQECKINVQENRWTTQQITLDQRIKYIAEGPTENQNSAKNSESIDLIPIIPHKMMNLVLAFDSRNAQTNERAVLPPTVSVWDFSGQDIYYNTHHFFLNKRSIYILVTKVDRVIQEEIEAFKFWINSIYFYSKHGTTEIFAPIVFLVGTHKDKLNFKTEEKYEEFKENYFQELLKPFIKSPQILALIHEKKFLVSNLKPNSPVFKLIRQHVYDYSCKQVNETPAIWIELEKRLKDRKADILTLSQVIEEGKCTTGGILTKDSIMEFLKSHHAMGNILYFDMKQQIPEEYVILNPSWAIIAFETFIKHIPDKKPLNLSEHKDFEKLSILRPKLLDEIMQKADPRVLRHKEQVMDFLEKLDVFARPVCCEELDDNSQTPLVYTPQTTKYLDLFVVPCLLKRVPGDFDLNSFICPDEKDKSPFSGKSFDKKSPLLCFVFDENFMPPAVFHRLLATCIRQYGVVSRDSDSEYLLYNGFGIFPLENNYRFMIRYVDHIIYCQIWGKSKGEKCLQYFPTKAESLREVLTKSLEYILGTSINLTKCAKNKSFEAFVQCPCTTEPGKCLFSVLEFCNINEKLCGQHVISRKDVLKVWFQKKLNELNHTN